MMFRLTVLVALGALLACAEKQSEPFTPYSLGQALVIGPDKGGRQTALDEACDGAGAECAAAVESCGNDAYADVVLDEQHDVLDVLCYPGNATVREIGVETVSSAEAGNHTVLVLDDVGDGADVSGNVTLAGNGAVVYGSGPGVSVIGGDLVIEKNNAIVRGVRIQGNVTVSKNNVRFALCEIDGDLTISANNATVAECVVHGQVRIEGNNAVFVRNELGSNDTLSGKNLRCNANTGLVDTTAPDAGTSTPTPIACDGS
jgi:hypothetical protein